MDLRTPTEKRLKFIGYLNIYSKDRTGNIESAQYNIKTKITGVDYLCVETCQMLNMQYDIAVGDQILFSFNSTTYSYVFTTSTAGIYTATTLCAFLQARIRTLTSSTTLTVTFDTVTNIISVNTGNTSTIQFLRSSLFRQLGFIRDSDNTTQVFPPNEEISFALPFPVSFPKTQYFDFTSKKLTQYQGPTYNTSLKVSNVICRLKNDMSFGNIINFDYTSFKLIPFDRNQILDIFDINIYNDDGTIPALNNSTYNITISLYSTE
jgi:hypothetical protein